MDFTNAFTSLNGSYSAVAQFMPALLPVARVCCGGHSPLFYGTTFISSQSGVPRLGPLVLLLVSAPGFGLVEARV